MKGGTRRNEFFYKEKCKRLEKIIDEMTSQIEDMMAERESIHELAMSGLPDWDVDERDSNDMLKALSYAAHYGEGET